ncbi:hypothetical protein FHL15_005705 [Xylaria flabelliformis]|uniref:C2H2-type domain-containing protein n=1 Tax=Xylaria flabelliformis TaxID=2512241 RepID=A0A553HZQ4_9PEZI|nr:hypothetical protein FHL15_005705 [Xylaria flabelliformis]
MVYSQSSGRTRTPTHRELYTNPTFNVNSDNVLNHPPYRTDSIPAISESSVHFALQRLAVRAPGTNDLPDFRGFVRPSNVARPTLDSGLGSGARGEPPYHGAGHSTFAADPDMRGAGSIAPNTGYSSLAGFSDITDWYSWSPQGTVTSPASPSPSTLSGAADARRFECNECPSSFAQNKDLNRHKKSVHPTGNEPLYRCRCGREGVRKDNYLRHVDPCSNEYRYPAYSCKCGHLSEHKEPHVEHVSRCRYGFRPVGRPRRAY